MINKSALGVGTLYLKVIDGHSLTNGLNANECFEERSGSQNAEMKCRGADGRNGTKGKGYIIAHRPMPRDQAALNRSPITTGCLTPSDS